MTLIKLVEKTIWLSVVALFVIAALQRGGALSPLEFSSEPLRISSPYLSVENTDKTRAYVAFLQGMLYARHGNHLKAQEKYRLAKEFDPESISVKVHLGVSLAQSGDHEAASEEFKQALEDHSHDPKVWMMTALIFVSQNRYDKAIEQFTRVLEVDPENVFVLTSLADLYALSDEIPKSIETLKQLVSVKPEPAFYFNLAILESRIGAFEDAEEHLTYVIEMEPKSTAAWVALGLIHEESGRYDDAIQTMESALALNREDTRLYHNLARLHLKTGELDLAVLEYQRVLEINPKDVNAVLDLIYLYLEMNRFQDAIQLADAGFNQGLNNSKLYLMKGYASTQLGMRDEAIELFKDALEMDPDIANAHFYLGVLLYESGEIELARMHIEKTVELDNAHAEAYNYLGYLYSEIDSNMDRAIAYFEKAIEIEPDNAAFIDAMGWAYYKKGLYAKSIHALEKALAINKDDIVIQKHLRDAYNKVGRRKEALDLFEDEKPATIEVFN